MWAGALAALAGLLSRALVRTARARPAHAAVVACAPAGLSFVYAAYPVVLARSPR
ncbi:hypothetical protein [Streptomyces sp. TP-A0356]|uniref:hypothetical protein n=1 Tax=Streptomyces sp. TP-A0356 TaxID=1359208 RepID=UPI000AC19BD0|nr:hypothetical protein [Streptomyces sp. TP-A0356]